MIAFLTLCYCGVVWLVFFKLKLLNFDTKAKIVVTTIGVLCIFSLVIAMNLFQPFCASATLYQRTIGLVPNVSGDVLEVNVEPNVPLKKGDVIFRIDPSLYQAEVDRLKALLAQAEQNVPQLKAGLDAAVARQAYLRLEVERLEQAVKTQAVSQTDVDRSRQQLVAAEADSQRARLAYESEIDGVNTTVARYRAELRAAEINLADCTYRAPADGFVTQLFLRPGVRATNLPLSPVGIFVYDETLRMAAAFSPNVLEFVKEGDSSEIVLDSYPGKVFEAVVEEIVPITGEGAVTPAGSLRDSTSFAERGQMLVLLKFDERFRDIVETPPPTGTGGTATIYTQWLRPISIVRKVVMRIQAWFNYV